MKSKVGISKWYIEVCQSRTMDYDLNEVRITLKCRGLNIDEEFIQLRSFIIDFREQTSKRTKTLQHHSPTF